MIRRTSSRETWRHDSRMRPHFGHFTIHWSRSSLPTLSFPRVTSPIAVGKVWRRRDSRSYLNIAGRGCERVPIDQFCLVIGGVITNRAFVSDPGRPVRGSESQAPPPLLATRGTRGPSAPRG